jgi:hypothetical protein
VITQHLYPIQLRSGQDLLVSNSRWLHGRDRYTGPARVTLPILDDPSRALVSSPANARHKQHDNGSVTHTTRRIVLVQTDAPVRVTIRCICSGIRVDRADPGQFAGPVGPAGGCRQRDGQVHPPGKARMRLTTAPVVAVPAVDATGAVTVVAVRAAAVVSLLAARAAWSVSWPGCRPGGGGRPGIDAQQ